MTLLKFPLILTNASSKCVLYQYFCDNFKIRIRTDSDPDRTVLYMCERRQVIRFPPDINEEITTPPTFSEELPPVFRIRNILTQIWIRILGFVL